MWILVGAVVTASVLGSMHCVGMCGPLAIWASGAADSSPGGNRFAPGKILTTTALYHFGRLLTYALAGLLAGLIGELTDFGGEVLGVQLAAARIVGSVMILIGVVRLTQLIWGYRQSNNSTIASYAVAKPLKPSPITRLLVRLRPYVFALPIKLRALATGLLTALLPCGWLYLFALVAAGTGSWMLGPIVMIAFWLGTVPALVGLVTGTRLLAGQFRKTIPSAAALMLIVAGGYTASGRGFANLNSLAEIHVAGLQHGKLTNGQKDASHMDECETCDVAVGLANDLGEIVKTPLPCCAGKEVFEKGAEP